GKPDLTVANFGPNRVSVLLNTTAGSTTPSFATQTTFATGAVPVSVTSGVLNGDGQPDLAVANYSSDDGSVLLNTTVLGAATVSPDFPEAATPAVGTQPVSVAIGDLNGDGKPDLAVANFDSDSVSVLPNTTVAGSTTPSFPAQTSFATGLV